MFWPTSSPHKKLPQLPITALRTAATALACSPTSQLPTASTHAASVTTSHALDRLLSKLSSAPAADFVDAAEFLDAADFTSAAEFPHCLIVSSQHCFFKPWTILAQAPTLVSILLR
jgi:hypothetical protein